MTRKHESWVLQELAAEDERQNILDQKSEAEKNKSRAGAKLDEKRDWQRKQQLKTDREKAENIARDMAQAQRKDERKRKEHDSKYYDDKRRAESNVSKQNALGVLPKDPVRGQRLRPQPKPKPRAREKTIEERRSLAKKQVKGMGTYGKH